VNTVLVTGGRGFIGQAVIRELVSRGIVAVPFDHPYDVRNIDELAKFSAVDGVINLAGILGTAETIGEEYEAAHVNILGALNVFDAFRNVPIVQIATGHEGQPNPYALTKACITGLALSRAQWMGQKIAVVRAYHVYGPGQKMCAPHGHSKVRKIVPSFVARALTGMPIEINGDGKQKVDLVYVDDCAKVLVDALTGPYGTVLDAGTGVKTTVLQAAHDVLVAAGVEKSEFRFGPMRKGEPEGAVVVAGAPLCSNPWPYRLVETVDWYREKLELAKAA
jgi:UDP-glucose 4-epimerase